MKTKISFLFYIVDQEMLLVKIKSFSDQKEQHEITIVASNSQRSHVNKLNIVQMLFGFKFRKHESKS